MINKLSITIAGVCAAASLNAATFVFNDSSTLIGLALDDSATGSFTVDMIELTANAGIGTFNATASNFGINQPSSGDDTDGFDFTESGGPGLAESFTLSFDQDVLLGSFSVSSFGVSDEITLLDGAITVVTVGSTGTASLGNYFLSSGSSLSVMTTAGAYGNGWSFDSIDVSAVPESGTYAMLAGFAAVGFAMLRRRRS